jgi:hypothetical protein
MPTIIVRVAQRSEPEKPLINFGSLNTFKYAWKLKTPSLARRETGTWRVMVGRNRDLRRIKNQAKILLLCFIAANCSVRFEGWILLSLKP